MDNLRPHYLKVIADLKRQRSKIDATLQNLEQLVAVIHPQPSATADPPVPTSPSHRLNRPPMMEMIKDILRTENRPMSPKDLALRLQQNGDNDVRSKNIGSMLSRRNKDVGDVVSFGYGQWGLKEWGPEVNPASDDREGVSVSQTTIVPASASMFQGS